MVKDSMDSSFKKVDPFLWIEGAIETTKEEAPSTGKLDRLVYGSFVGVAIPILAGSVTSLFLWMMRKGGLFARLFVCPWLLISSIPVIQANWLLIKFQRALQEEDVGAAQHALTDLSGSDQSNQITLPALRLEAIKTFGDAMVSKCVGPCFYFVLFGIPGVFVYRTILIMDKNMNQPTPTEVGMLIKLLRGSADFIPRRISRYFISISSWLIEEDLSTENQQRSSGRGPEILIRSSASTGPVRKDSNRDNVRLENPPKEDITSEQVGRTITLVQVASVLVLLTTFLLSILSVGITRRK
tara:strand:- start:746 stop:1639 length:894 start_codon:yes stop_codon:yes gene_type:complete